MEIQEQLEAHFREASLYQQQGLLEEARALFQDIVKRIQTGGARGDLQELLEATQARLGELQSEASEIRELTAAPRVSSKAQGLIRSLFSSQEEPDGPQKALQEAAALADFGQTEAALAELGPLLEIKEVRVHAAEQILRCHVMAGELERALGEYRGWRDGDRFSEKQWKALEEYFEKILLDSGEKCDLGQLLKDRTPLDMQGGWEILDFNQLEFVPRKGPLKGKRIDLEVSYQKGSVVRVFIAGKHEALLEELRPGARLPEVLFFAPPHAILRTFAKVLAWQGNREEIISGMGGVELEIGLL